MFVETCCFVSLVKWYVQLSFGRPKFLVTARCEIAQLAQLETSCKVGKMKISLQTLGKQCCHSIILR